MQQQDSKSIVVENQEAKTDEGTRFEKSLQVSIEIFCTPHACNVLTGNKWFIRIVLSFFVAGTQGFVLSSSPCCKLL